MYFARSGSSAEPVNHISPTRCPRASPNIAGSSVTPHGFSTNWGASILLELPDINGLSQPYLHRQDALATIGTAGDMTKGDGSRSDDGALPDRAPSVSGRK